MAKKKTDPVPELDLPFIAEGLRSLAVPIESVDPDPANARSHDEANVSAIRGSLRTYGQRKPIVVNRRTNTVEAGNGTLTAARSLGWTHIAVTFVDDDPIVAAGFAIADNRAAELATWDNEALTLLLPQLDRECDELAAMIEAMEAERGTGEPEPGLTDPDAVPEQPAEPVTRTGDIWVMGTHRLMCGDSTDAGSVALLMNGEKVDLIVTDPPYGVDFKRGQFITDPSRPLGATRGVCDELQGDGRKAEDQANFIKAVFEVARPHCRPAASVYMFSATLQPGAHSMLGLTSAGVHVQSQLVWVKNNHVLGIADYHWKHEICWYGWYEGAPHRWFGERNKFTVLEFNRVQATFHPSEKPVDLIGYFIENSSLAGEICFDPFAGSGTAWIAAERIGRRCYGLELDPKFVDATLRRWTEFTGLEAIRESDGAKFSELAGAIHA